MIKLQELNRHMIAIPALTLLIAGLGFLGSREFGPRPVEGLSAALPQFVQQQIGEAQSELLSGLSRLPPNAYGSAAQEDKALSSDSAAKMAMQTPGGAQQDKEISPASESKFWSDKEWQAAAKAVADLRSSRKAEVTNNMGDLRWQPPEEINKNAPSQSR